MRYLLSLMLLLFLPCAFADTDSASPVLVFVSFSMPKESLKAWMKQAERIHAPLVVRGLVNNSFKETVQQMGELVQDNQGGIQVDPILFQQYQITKVPALLVRKAGTCAANQTCMDFFDVVYGDATMEYALRIIESRQDELSGIASNALQLLRGVHGT